MKHTLKYVFSQTAANSPRYSPLHIAEDTIESGTELFGYQTNHEHIKYQNFLDIKLIRYQIFRYRTYQIPRYRSYQIPNLSDTELNLSDTKLIRYQTYQIPKLSDTKLIRYQTHQIPNLSDTELIRYRT
jgi:hypothetical protein